MCQWYIWYASTPSHPQLPSLTLTLPAISYIFRVSCDINTARKKLSKTRARQKMFKILSEKLVLNQYGRSSSTSHQLKTYAHICHCQVIKKRRKITFSRYQKGTSSGFPLFLSPEIPWFLPAINEVYEGYVFTGVCLSTGEWGLGLCPGGGGVSVPPGQEVSVQGSLSGRLAPYSNKRAVRILLECILVPWFPQIFPWFFSQISPTHFN